MSLPAIDLDLLLTVSGGQAAPAAPADSMNDMYASAINDGMALQGCATLDVNAQSLAVASHPLASVGQSAADLCWQNLRAQSLSRYTPQPQPQQ